MDTTAFDSIFTFLHSIIKRDELIEKLRIWKYMTFSWLASAAADISVDLKSMLYSMIKPSKCTQNLLDSQIKFILMSNSSGIQEI